MTLELEWQKAEQERQEDTHQHEPPEVEFGFYNQVQQGDVDAVQENLRSGLYRQIAMRVRLSDDLVQNFRYHCIVCQWYRDFVLKAACRGNRHIV